MVKEKKSNKSYDWLYNLGILVTHSTLLGRMTILIKAMKITLLPFKVKGLSKSMFLNFERSEKNM